MNRSRKWIRSHRQLSLKHKNRTFLRRTQRIRWFQSWKFVVPTWQLWDSHTCQDCSQISNALINWNQFVLSNRPHCVLKRLGWSCEIHHNTDEITAKQCKVLICGFVMRRRWNLSLWILPMRHYFLNYCSFCRISVIFLLCNVPHYSSMRISFIPLCTHTDTHTHGLSVPPVCRHTLVHFSCGVTHC